MITRISYIKKSDGKMVVEDIHDGDNCAAFEKRLRELKADIMDGKISNVSITREDEDGDNKES